MVPIVALQSGFRVLDPRIVSGLVMLSKANGSWTALAADDKSCLEVVTKMTILSG